MFNEAEAVMDTKELLNWLMDEGLNVNSIKALCKDKRWRKTQGVPKAVAKELLKKLKK